MLKYETEALSVYEIVEKSSGMTKSILIVSRDRTVIQAVNSCVDNGLINLVFTAI